MTPNADYVWHYGPEESLRLVCEAARLWMDEYGPELDGKSVFLALLDLSPNGRSEP